MKCEFCGSEHNGSYGSGRFCSVKCARLYAIDRNNKKDKFVTGICKNCNNEFQVKRGTPKEWYICDNCKNVFFGSRKRTSSRIHTELVCTICEKICSVLVPESEINRFSDNYKCKDCLREINKQAQLTRYKNLPWDQTSHFEKYRRILQDQNNKCLLCGISEWNNKKLKLHLDHIDGNKLNNSRENLRLICPNCHSQTDTYCKAKCGFKTTDSQIIDSIIKNNYDIQKAIIDLGLSVGGQTLVRFQKIYFRIKNNIMA